MAGGICTEAVEVEPAKQERFDFGLTWSQAGKRGGRNPNIAQVAQVAQIFGGVRSGQVRFFPGH